MELWTLSGQKTHSAGFIRYWSEAYDYADEDSYTNNIGKPLTKRRLMELFRWKNGREISAGKKASIVRNYLPHVRGAKSEDDVWNLIGGPGGAIWNIFFAHCLMPDTFPMYDQHVHRAMMYLGTGQACELPNGKRAVIDCYRDHYIDFLEAFEGVAPRSVDRALWAFGKFVKLNPWATRSNMREMVRGASTETIATFDADRIARLREAVRDVAEPPREGPDGWARSTIDPMKLLALFKPLKLKEGFVLHAYQFRSGGNGNGFVFALPEGSPLPEPEECRPEKPERPRDFEPQPSPDDAEWDVMGLIEGDGSPWSYMLASILERELGEFGAIWHGCSWDAHRILGEDPLSFGRRIGTRRFGGEGPHTGSADWMLRGPKPRQWQPVVGKEAGRTVVRFYTYSGLDREAIYENVDTYEPDSYYFETESTVLADGEGGYVF